MLTRREAPHRPCKYCVSARIPEADLGPLCSEARPAGHCMWPSSGPWAPAFVMLLCKREAASPCGEGGRSHMAARGGKGTGMDPSLLPLWLPSMGAACSGACSARLRPCSQSHRSGYLLGAWPFLHTDLRQEE